MDLKIKDVSELLSVSETTVRRWLQQGKIPAYRINGQYRFSRVEIEDWVMSHRLGNGNNGSKSSSLLSEPTGNDKSQGTKQFSLFRAINRGGVYKDVPGDTKEQVIQHAMKLIAKPLDLDAEVLTELLLDRERLMPTALNNGIGIPHTRDFLMNTPYDIVAVVFPRKPIDYGALDNKPVSTLFFLLACEDKRHLHLLAKIAHLSSSPEAVEVLKSQPEKRELLGFIKEWELQPTALQPQ